MISPSPRAHRNHLHMMMMESWETQTARWLGGRRQHFVLRQPNHAEIQITVQSICLFDLWTLQKRVSTRRDGSRTWNSESTRQIHAY